VEAIMDRCQGACGVEWDQSLSPYTVYGKTRWLCSDCSIYAPNSSLAAAPRSEEGSLFYGALLIVFLCGASFVVGVWCGLSTHGAAGKARGHHVYSGAPYRQP
jgi:hypothetical protein